jgi:hypothetical protein
MLPIGKAGTPSAGSLTRNPGGRTACPRDSPAAGNDFQPGPDPESRRPDQPSRNAPPRRVALPSGQAGDGLRLSASRPPLAQGRG